MRCRRLLQTREAAIGRGRTTGAVAARTSEGPHQRPLAQPRPYSLLKKFQAVANPCSHPSLPPKQTITNQVKSSLRRSIAVSPSLLPAWGIVELRQPTQDIPKAIASWPVPAKTICQKPRRSGKDACPRSPRWLPQRVIVDLCSLFGF